MKTIVTFQNGIYAPFQQVIPHSEYEVLEFNDNLSIGNIQNINTQTTREFVYQISSYSTGDSGSVYYTNQSKQFHTKIKQATDIIIVFEQNSTRDLCGLMYVIWMLQNRNVNTQLISIDNDTMEKAFYKGVQSSPENGTTKFMQYKDSLMFNVKKLLSTRLILNPSETHSIIKKWESLAFKNHPMRILENNKLVGTGYNYFDKILLSYIPSHSIRLGDLIGLNLINIPLDVGFLVWRYYIMLQEGALLGCLNQKAPLDSIIHDVSAGK